MLYLFFQIWIWLLVAFVLGWAAHWFLCCRNKDNEIDAEANKDSATLAAVSAAAASPAAPMQAASDNWKPQSFAAAPDQIDDLKRIKGVGGVIEQTLNGLGVYQFTQIAEWNDDNISWVENSLSFPGRIGREDWVNQAKTLREGGTTEFAQRVDKGDVDYD